MSQPENLTQSQQTELEAAAFRRLVAHLQGPPGCAEY